MFLGSAALLRGLIGLRSGRGWVFSNKSEGCSGLEELKALRESGPMARTWSFKLPDYMSRTAARGAVVWPCISEKGTVIAALVLLAQASRFLKITSLYGNRVSVGKHHSKSADSYRFVSSRLSEPSKKLQASSFENQYRWVLFYCGERIGLQWN